MLRLVLALERRKRTSTDVKSRSVLRALISILRVSYAVRELIAHISASQHEQGTLYFPLTTSRMPVVLSIPRGSTKVNDRSTEVATNATIAEASAETAAGAMAIFRRCRSPGQIGCRILPRELFQRKTTPDDETMSSNRCSSAPRYYLQARMTGILSCKVFVVIGSTVGE